jgi:hypothetical protein
MINLKKLALYITIDRVETFIDGNDFKNIIKHLKQLNTFIFNIRSSISLDHAVQLPSNEQIQDTFTNFKDNQIISCVDYFSKKRTGQCHIYSCPYTMSYYHGITNNFPGGLFKCVREISLFDERPFEHEFFIRIAQSFPSIEKLSLSNRKPQKHKEYQNSKDDNKHFPVIEYPRLTELEFTNVHKDYLELFLDHTKTSLPNNIFLSPDYGPLRKATHNFKRDSMRVNCAKVTQLWISDNFKISQCFKAYFPRVKKF